MITVDDIDPEPTRGRRTDRLYRRVRLPDLVDYNGVVRYAPELEQAVDDVRGYIAGQLAVLLKRCGGSETAFLGRLYSPFDVPMPGEADGGHRVSRS